MGHDYRMPAAQELVSRFRIFITIRVIPRAELAARLGLPSVAIMRAAVEKLKLWENGARCGSHSWTVTPPCRRG